MLVEDDNNLREIYEARLLAEGYEIVSAKDGEEALALAVKEKPDLIISDVMMPKISGFDMLDILRSTAETKNTKVIMMTALSQAEDKTRADKLGADRYLVKSQVTLEDVAKVAHDVLAGEAQAAAATAAPAATPQPAAPAEPAPAATTPSEPTAPVAAPAPAPAPEPPTATPTPIQVSEPAADPVPAADNNTTTEPAVSDDTSTPGVEPPAAAPEPTPVPEPAPEPPKAEEAPEPDTPAALGISDDLTQTTAAEEAAIESQINEVFAEPAADTAAPSVETAEAPVAEPSAPAAETIEVATPPSDTPVATEAPEPTPEPPKAATPPDVNETSGKRVIKPINDITKSPNLNDLLKKEEANDGITPPTATTVLNPSLSNGPAMQDVTPPPPSGGTVAPGDIAL